MLITEERIAAREHGATDLGCINMYELRTAVEALRDGYLTGRRLTGSTVRFARKALGLLQTELAYRLGHAPGTISRWENDKLLIPEADVSTLVSLLEQKIAEAGGTKMLITEEHIALARKKGACKEALDWIEAEPRTTDQLAARNIGWARWAIRRLSDDALLDALALHAPAYALRCASARLTPERLDACAAMRPYAALCYAADRLSPERLDACASAEPCTALRCASARLSPERLDACAAAEPCTALSSASDRLSPERLDACAAANPRAALYYAADRLTPERLDACAVVHPRIALRYVADRLTPERLDACHAQIDR